MSQINTEWVNQLVNRFFFCSTVCIIFSQCHKKSIDDKINYYFIMKKYNVSEMPSMRTWQSGILTLVLHVQHILLCFQSGRKINSNIVLTFCLLGTNYSVFIVGYILLSSEYQTLLKQKLIFCVFRYSYLKFTIYYNGTKLSLLNFFCVIIIFILTTQI